MRVGGIVLCGGRSSRMGRPKAWLPFAGEPMLARVARVMRSVVEPVVVVAAPGQDVPPLPSAVRVVRDEVEGRGPLAGLASGLTALTGTCDAAFLSSCDVPFLQPQIVRRLIDRLGDAVIAVPHVGGFHHPLAAVYSTSVLPHGRQLLAADRARMTDLFTRVPTRIIEPHDLADLDPDFRSFRNVNTPEEYAAALAEERPG